MPKKQKTEDKQKLINQTIQKKSLFKRSREVIMMAVSNYINFILPPRTTNKPQVPSQKNVTVKSQLDKRTISDIKAQPNISPPTRAVNVKTHDQPTL